MDQAESLRRMMRNQRRMTSPTNTTKGIQIFAIASGKGGVGKTNFVVNLAIGLQRRGKGC